MLLQCSHSSAKSIDARFKKKAPSVPGLQDQGEAPKGNEPLDAPILSQSTNQARRGTKCNVPGWAGGETGDFNGHAVPLKPRHRRKPGLFLESRPRRKA